MAPANWPGCEVQARELGVGGRVGGGATLADFSDQALRHQGADGGGDQEGLDADVNQTGDGAGSVIGVEGGEDQVAGEGGVDGDGGGLHVADFPQHDDVGRLAQHGAQGDGKGQADGFADLHLVDAGEQILHRVLDRDDLAVRAVDEIQAGIEGGGLAGAGGAGDQKDAVGQADEALEGLLVVGEKAQFGQPEAQALPCPKYA